MKPVIGISTSIMREVGGITPNYEQIHMSKDYVDAIIEAGGLPILIPLNLQEEVIKQQVSMLDALILSGGYDVFPYNYGQEPHPKCGEYLLERDEFEFKLLKEAKEKQIPILGICRGLQLINSFEGGDLYQDLSLIKGDILQHVQKCATDKKTQKVKLTNPSFLSDILPNEFMINSFHHQCIKNVAKEYTIIAQTSDDVIEAIQHRKYPFLLAVQWHPEMLHKVCNESKKIFKLFVEKAIEYKNLNKSEVK